MLKNHIAGWAAATSLLIPATAGSIPTPIEPVHPEPSGILALAEDPIMTPPELLKGGNYVVLKGLKYADGGNRILVCSQSGEPLGEYASENRLGSFVAVHANPAKTDYSYIYDVDTAHNGGNGPVHMSIMLTPNYIHAYAWDSGQPKELAAEDIDSLHHVADELLSACNSIRGAYVKLQRQARTHVGIANVSIDPARYALQLVKDEPLPSVPTPDAKTLGPRGPK